MFKWLLTMLIALFRKCRRTYQGEGQPRVSAGPDLPRNPVLRRFSGRRWVKISQTDCCHCPPSHIMNSDEQYTLTSLSSDDPILPTLPSSFRPLVQKHIDVAFSNEEEAARGVDILKGVKLSEGVLDSLGRVIDT